VTSIIASWFIEFQPCVTSVRGIFVIPSREIRSIFYSGNILPCLKNGSDKWLQVACGDDGKKKKKKKNNKVHENDLA